MSEYQGVRQERTKPYYRQVSNLSSLRGPVFDSVVASTSPRLVEMSVQRNHL